MKTATTFSAKNNPLLQMLRGGKCLDDILVLPPETDRRLDEINRIITGEDESSIEKANQLKALPLSEKKKLLFEFDEQVKAHQDFLKPGHVAWFYNCYKGWEKAEPSLTDQQASDFERVFDTPQPQVYFIPKVTQGALTKAWPSIQDRLSDIIPDLPTETGILMSDEFQITDSHTPYDICCIYHVNPDRLTAAWITRAHQTGTVGLLQLLQIEFASNIMVAINCDQDDAVIWMGQLISRLVFIYFFQVEKIVAESPANSRYVTSVKTEDGTRYDTTLSYPINVIDARWFTKLVKTNPSFVKGHFRNQPYGSGRGMYKIIWIDSHTRSGYTRKAKTREPLIE